MNWFQRILYSLGLYTPPAVQSPKPQPAGPAGSGAFAANSGVSAQDSLPSANTAGSATQSTTTPSLHPIGVQKMSDAGLVQTKYCEGLYLTAEPDSRGVPTIGWGRIEYDDGTRVKNGDTCTIIDAAKWLLEDVENDGSHYVRAWVKTPLTQNQFDALSDFTFNRGAGRLKTLLAMPGNIYDNFLTAVPGDKELGLQRRRRMNRAMYLGEDWTVFKEWMPS